MSEHFEVIKAPDYEACVNKSCDYKPAVVRIVHHEGDPTGKSYKYVFDYCADCAMEMATKILSVVTNKE